MIAVNKPAKDDTLPLEPQAFTAIECNLVVKAMEPSFNQSTEYSKQSRRHKTYFDGHAVGKLIEFQHFDGFRAPDDSGK